MVIFGGIDRLFLLASPRKYTLLEVCVEVDRKVKLPAFTGKVPKSLLIKSNPTLEEVFAKPTILEVDGIKITIPKPLRLTTLYINTSSGKVFLWKKSLNDRNHLYLPPNRDACFLVGFDETVEEAVYDAVMGLDRLELFDAYWSISSLKVLESYKLPSSSHGIRLEGVGAIRLVIRTPVKLVDPWAKSKYGRFLPLAGIVFSYNIGDLLRIWKRENGYWDLVGLVSASLRETYRILETAKPVKYVYDGKELPALGGSITYIVDWSIIDRVQGLKELLENIIAHAKIMGIGSSRAIGLGHVEIKLLTNND